MSKELYSNGKLLLTAEYAILDGAKGLALPTKFGQFLNLQRRDFDVIEWISINDQHKPWFTATISRSNLQLIKTSDEDIAHRLIQILSQARKLNPLFLDSEFDYNHIEARLTFPRNWGLGSSSTLIVNIAEWAKINPYHLLSATFGGSGYDIACAQHNTALLYEKSTLAPKVTTFNYQPPFAEHLFFVYLNQKKNSRDAIAAYRNLNFNKHELKSKINEITTQIIDCKNLAAFEQLLNDHETILSNTLKTPTIKELLFSDYKNTIKSLGAWGGDFILATGKKAEMAYFKQKGYDTILSYSEMIL